MPQLPDFTALGNRPTPQPSAGVASYRPTTGFEGATADAMSTAGNEFGKAAVALEQYQAVQDETNANDVYANKFSPAFREMYQGYRALQGKDAVDQMPAYVEKMQGLRKEVMESLPNSRQQKLFNEYSRRRVEMELDNMAMHSNAQGKLWQIGTHKSNLQNDLSVIADQPDNQVSFLDALELGRKHIYDFDKANGGVGIHGLNVQEEFKLFTSEALRTKLESLLYKNPLLAQKEWNDPETRKMIDPKHRAVLGHKIEEAAMVVGTSAVANTWVDESLRDMPAKPEATLPRKKIGQAIFGQESSSGAANTAFVNPQGVTGPMQIKDTTWQQYQNMGVIPKNLKWDNPQDNKEGGMLLTEYYYDKYGGDPAKVAAAYYGGEGAVNADGSINRHWRNLQRPNDPTVGQYVDQVLARMGGPQGVMLDTNGLPNTRDVKAQLPILLAKVNPWLDQTYGTDPTNPMRIRAANAITNSLSARINREATQLDAVQKQAQGELIDAIAGFGGGKEITSYSEIQSNPKLMRAWQTTDPAAKLGLSRLIEGNAREDKTGNPTKYWEAFQRVHLQPGDPNKIDFYQDLLPYAGPGGVNTTQLMQLKQQLDLSGTVGGKGVSQLMATGAKSVESAFKSSTLSYIPGAVPDALAQWTAKMGEKVDEYRAAKKDVRTLFMYDTPDSIVNPKYLNTFITKTPAQALAAGAAPIKAGASIAAVVQPANIDTREKLDAWFQTLPTNAVTFVGTDGITRGIPNRVPQQLSTTPATSSTAPEVIAPDSARVAEQITIAAKAPDAAATPVTQTVRAPVAMVTATDAEGEVQLPQMIQIKRPKPGMLNKSVPVYSADFQRALKGRDPEFAARDGMRGENVREFFKEVGVNYLDKMLLPVTAAKAIWKAYTEDDPARHTLLFRGLLKYGYSEGSEGAIEEALKVEGESPIGLTAMEKRQARLMLENIRKNRAK